MEIDAKSKECPICGYEFPGYSPAVKWTALILAIIFLLSFLLAVRGYF
jgi:hypothetical protein